MVILLQKNVQIDPHNAICIYKSIHPHIHSPTLCFLTHTLTHKNIMIYREVCYHDIRKYISM